MIKFSELKRPAIISSLRVKTLNDAIRDIKDSEKQGADGFLLHIEMLDNEFRNAETVGKIISATNKPVMALNYRDGEEKNHQILADFLLKSVSLGAAAVTQSTLP